MRTLGVAYPLLALVQTGSPIAAGWAGFALTIPILVFYVPGGFLVDWTSPRLIILWAEVGRVISVASVLLAMSFGGPSLAHLIIAAAVEGTLWVLYTLAESALLPSIVQPVMMHGALAKNEAGNHLASIAGRPLGGYLFGLGHYVPFAVNAVLFFLSWSLFLNWSGDSARRKTRPSRLHDLRQGFDELAGQPFLRSSILVTTFTNLLVNTLIMIFVAGSEGMSPLKLGLVLAAGGLGGVAGSILAFALPPVRRVLRLHLWIWVVALGLAAVGAAVGLRSSSFAMALVVTGIGGALSNVAIRSVEVHMIDRGTLARVVGVSRLSSHGALCLAAPLGGLMVTWWGVSGGSLVLFLIMLIAATAMTGWKPARVKLTPLLPHELPKPAVPRMLRGLTRLAALRDRALSSGADH